MQGAVLEQVVPVMDAPAGIEERLAPARTRADEAMDRYADGDESAFGLLYDELAPRLYRFALRQTRSGAASEDVVQQAFLQLHASRARFVRGAAVVPWAFAIARRLLVDARRRGAREARHRDGGVAEGRPAPSPVDDALATLEQERAARRDLEALPPALREPFQLVKLEGLSVAEAAAVLAITPGMVKVRAHRARVRLEEAARARGACDERPRTPGAAGGGTP